MEDTDRSDRSCASSALARQQLCSLPGKTLESCKSTTPINLPMYKSLKPQLLSFNNSVHSPFLLFYVSSSEDRCLAVSIFRSFPAILFSLHFTSPGRSESYVLSFHPTILSCRDVLQIAHCSLDPRFDVLRQCCSHCSCSSVPPRPRCTTRTWLTSDLVLARQACQYEPDAAPAPSRKFLFLGLIASV
jgi:hypothetical protein